MDVVDRLNQALSERYQIEREIGSGGMATVYLAQDLKHNRKVAIKVLKPELAAVMGTERFLAEIRTTANLTHPQILPLHDSGEADGFLFYVMPYVDGESLRQRLDREGQLPVAEAVRIVSRVADALDYAHRQGVIHRDIKPANILFEDQQPVVTDFGIALAVSAAGEGRLTETGLSLGTPYYMSPEQAAGDQIPTAASDVYSLGCVLYEMLTGDPPHTGSSAQAILGKILLGEVVRPTKLRRTIPTNVEGVILKALERFPADRFETVAELAAALKEKSFRHGTGVGAGGSRGPWNWLSIGLAVVAGLALIAAVTGILAPEPQSPPVHRIEIRQPGTLPSSPWARYFALAPDGSSMVYSDTVGLESGWQLWVKERESPEGRPLSGTARARDIVYSPDGEWIAYTAGGDLVKRPLRGAGSVTLLGDMDNAVPAVDWLRDGTLLCEQHPGTLVRISEQTGSHPDTVINFGTDNPVWVRGLPGERAALVVLCPFGSCTRESFLSVVDLQSGSARSVLDEVIRAWYVDTGHVVWVRRDGAVFATPFDLDRLQMSNSHVPLFEGVRASGTTLMTADMVMDREGTVVFVEGAGARTDLDLVWVDRNGGEEPVEVAFTVGMDYPDFSPDGTRLAVSSSAGEGANVWVLDLSRRVPQKLTGELATRPAWTPDGRSVTFTSGGVQSGRVWTIRADGGGNVAPLFEFERAVADAVWSPDGAWLIFRTSRFGDDPGDILAWQVGQDDPPIPLVATEFQELAPTVSPNGRFLAYSSNRSGLRQIYVQPFPNVNEGMWQLSSEGGIEPIWAKDGKELFYRNLGSGYLVAVEVETEGSFRIGEERALFPVGRYSENALHPRYDVAPDGQRFAMLRLPTEVEDASRARMIMIQNFFTELKEKVGGGR